MKKSKIITLCGSTRFKELFETVMKELTLQGHIVISVGCFGHRDADKRIMQKKELLDQIHLQKIDIANEIFVIDPNGYIGESTKKEISYAQSKNKKVRYYSQEKNYFYEESVYDVYGYP